MKKITEIMDSLENLTSDDLEMYFLIEINKMEERIEELEKEIEEFKNKNKIKK